MAEKSKPKETRVFNGKEYLLEESIFGDYALVKAHKADKLGNCQFRKSMNNFNEAMGKNAKFTIVEADEIVEVGEIDPENIHLQGIYVGSRAMFERMNRAVELHQMRPIVDKVFPFAEARAAFEAMENQSHFGKVAIRFD